MALLMGGALVAAYQIIQNMGRLSTKATTQDEISFVLRKIDWALTGANPSSIIPWSGSISNLSLIKYDGTAVSIRLSGTPPKIEINVGGAGYLPITTENVLVSSLSFYILPGTPIGIEAATIINGIVATTTKDLR